MNNEYTKVELPKLWPEYRTSETGNKFNKPTLKRRYVKILAMCLTYVPAKVIYRGVKNPLMHQVRDMCRAGLLNRYSKEGDRKYYYKVTNDGIELLMKALKEGK